MISWEEMNVFEKEALNLQLTLYGTVNDLVCGGYLPLTHATLKGNTSVVTWLLDNGADINGRDKWENTALYYALKSDNYSLTELLLMRGANPNLHFFMHFPLRFVIRFCDSQELTLLLLSFGANVKKYRKKYIDHIAWWFEDILRGRDKCRAAAVTFLGIRRFRGSGVFAGNGIDIARYIAKMVWKMQLLNEWVTPSY